MELNFFPIQPFLFTILNNPENICISPSILEFRKLYIFKSQCSDEEIKEIKIIPSAFCQWVIGFNKNDPSCTFKRLYTRENSTVLSIPKHDIYYTVAFDDCDCPVNIKESFNFISETRNLILSNSYEEKILIDDLRKSCSINESASIIADFIEYYMFFIPVNSLAEKVQKLIYDNSGFISIEDISSNIGYSTRHISREFKKSFGFTPKDYCEYVRFQHVLREILKNPSTKISSYLDDTIYSDQPHFQREFKHFCDITPRQFIQLIKKKI